MSKAWKWDLDEDIMGPYTNIFAPKTDHVFTQFAQSENIRYPKRTVVWIDLSSLYYLKCQVMLKLMITSSTKSMTPQQTMALGI